MTLGRAQPDESNGEGQGQEKSEEVLDPETGDA
jgi:hypothetical protein